MKGGKMSIVMVERDKKDSSAIHIYTQIINTKQYHITTLHIESASELFEFEEGLGHILNENGGKIWISSKLEWWKEEE
jgi:hypothetical protein